MNPLLPELEAQRAELFEQLLAVGDFRRGSVSENYHRCGKPNCACAAPEHPGHGPRLRREVEAYQRFSKISAQIALVNEAICEARPVDPPGVEPAGKAQDAGSDGIRGLSSQVRDGLAAAFTLELTRLLELATDVVSGPRVGCGKGHQAGFVGYRDKTIHTVLGPVRLTRAWYQCRVCRQGYAPLDRHLDVAGTSYSPGLAAMIDIAAAAAPFTAASGLLADLAGVKVGAKSIERVAEADGLAAQAEQAERAAEIVAGRLVPLPAAPAPGGEVPDMLYVAIDGTGVPMRSAETEGRAGKHPDGRTRTREGRRDLRRGVRLDRLRRPPLGDRPDRRHQELRPGVPVWARLIRA